MIYACIYEMFWHEILICYQILLVSIIVHVYIIYAYILQKVALAALLSSASKQGINLDRYNLV